MYVNTLVCMYLKVQEGNERQQHDDKSHPEADGDPGAAGVSCGGRGQQDERDTPGHSA